MFNISYHVCVVEDHDIRVVVMVDGVHLGIGGGVGLVAHGDGDLAEKPNTCGVNVLIRLLCVYEFDFDEVFRTK